MAPNMLILNPSSRLLRTFLLLGSYLIGNHHVVECREMARNNNLRLEQQQQQQQQQQRRAQDPCVDLTLAEAIDKVDSLSREDGFNCFKEYFEDIGKDQNTTTFSLGSESYIGEMEWFNGGNFLKRIVNFIWIGMTCKDDATSSQCSIRNRFPFNRNEDIGIVTYESPCPGLDQAYPCLKIDFTSGSLPRFYYIRKVSDTQFISFVETQDGSGDFSDVNILTKLQAA